MKQIYWIIGIIVLVIIASFVIMSIIREQSKPLPQLVMLPNLNFEGSVISLSLVGGVEEGGDITRPKDTAVVRIDKINSISSDFDWVSAGVEEGKEIVVKFQYSVRPAKLKQVFDSEAPISLGNETPVSATLSFTKENGYFVYSTKSGTITEETEIILSGLENSSKFKATGWYGYSGIKDLTIGKYEII